MKGLWEGGLSSLNSFCKKKKWLATPDHFYVSGISFFLKTSVAGILNF
jgi:hypothetical protein